jgi:hypothetical protein
MRRGDEWNKEKRRGGKNIKIIGKERNHQKDNMKTNKNKEDKSSIQEKRKNVGGETRIRRSFRIQK